MTDKKLLQLKHKELDESLRYRFIERGGQAIQDGKSNYPDFMLLLIKRKTAFRFAMQILKELEMTSPDDESWLEIPLSGLMERKLEDNFYDFPPSR